MSERFWEFVCELVPIWGILLGFSIVMFTLNALSLYASRPGEGTSQVVVINFFLITSLIIALAATIRKCRMGTY